MTGVLFTLQKMDPRCSGTCSTGTSLGEYDRVCSAQLVLATSCRHKWFNRTWIPFCKLQGTFVAPTHKRELFERGISTVA